MNLFDSLIKELTETLNSTSLRSLGTTNQLLEDLGKNNMVFASDKAYELGGEFKKSLAFELVSSNSDLIDEDEIILIGNDLNEIKKDCDFIRIALMKVADHQLSGNDLYGLLERIKFTKYRVSPKGYMLRTATSSKEKVRLSKECAKHSFSQIGSAYIKAYKQIPDVEAVKLIYITNGQFYSEFARLNDRRNTIMDTIDHILKGMTLNDCNACSVKELCDEVEGLRQLHKGQ